jgi:uncharacterized C2H2 Zn-finger protein
MIQLRAEEIELRDRNSVLRASNGGKIHVSRTFFRQHVTDHLVIRLYAQDWHV